MINCCLSICTDGTATINVLTFKKAYVSLRKLTKDITAANIIKRLSDFLITVAWSKLRAKR